MIVDCFNTCFQEYLIQNLGCYFTSFPYLSNSNKSACLIGLDMFNSLSLFTLFYIQDVATKCSDCPLECDSEFYSLTTSSLDYPTKIYADMLANQPQMLRRFNNKTPTYQQLKQSIVSLNINYNDLSYTQINELQKITLLDLITNIGGAMGLFLGLSFISLFEIAQLVVELIFFCNENYSFKQCFFRYFNFNKIQTFSFIQ